MADEIFREVAYKAENSEERKNRSGQVIQTYLEKALSSMATLKWDKKTFPSFTFLGQIGVPMENLMEVFWKTALPFLIVVFGMI